MIVIGADKPPCVFTAMGIVSQKISYFAISIALILTTINFSPRPYPLGPSHLLHFPEVFIMATYVIYGIKDEDNDYSVIDTLEAKSKKQAVQNFFLYSNVSGYMPQNGIYAKKVK